MAGLERNCTHRGRFSSLSQRQWLLLLLALAVFSSPASAQQDPPTGGDGRLSGPRQVTGKIVGRVLERPGGQGLRGMRLLAESSMHIHQALSDDNGGYEILDVEPGVYRLFLNPGLVGTGYDETTVRVLDREVSADDLCFLQSQWISGTIRDLATGEPVPGVRMVISKNHGDPRRLVTDAAGKFRFELRPREWLLECDGLLPVLAPCDGLGNISTKAHERHLNLEAGKPLEDVDFTITPTPVIQGRVLTAEGQPAAGIKVSIHAVWNRVGRRGGARPELQQVGTASFVRGPMTSNFMDGGGQFPSRAAIGAITDHAGRYQAHLVGSRGGWDPSLWGDPEIVPWVEEIVALTGDLSQVGKAAAGEMDVQLGPAASVRFRVLDAAGQPRDINAFDMNGRNVPMEITRRLPTRLGVGEYQITGLVHELRHTLRIGEDGKYESRRFQLQPGEARDLGDIHPQLQRSLNDVLAGLDSKNNLAFDIACSELPVFGRSGLAALPHLQAVLKDPERIGQRGQAAVAIGKFGPDAAAAVPDLIAVAESSTTHFHQMLQGLAAIGDDRAIPLLQRHLMGNSSWQFEAAAEALTRFPAEKSVPLLIPRLLPAIAADQDPNAPKLDTICRAIGAFKQEAKSAVPELLKVVSLRPNRWTGAVAALGAIGDPAALPVLEEIAKEESLSISHYRTVTQAIVMIREKSP